MPKIFAISDLHLSTNCDKPMDIFGGAWENYLEEIISDWSAKVECDDVVLIGGDISWAMNINEALSDLDLISSQSGKKILIRGNHDYWWSTISKVRAALTKDTFALQNDAIKFGNVVICGSRGWIVPDDINNFPEHDLKIYLREAERMELSLKQAKTLMSEGDKLLVLTHFPPFNVRREDSALINLFQKYNVSKVVYGHLHGSGARRDLYLKRGGIEYFLTSCDQTKNKLVLIDEF